MGLSKEKIGKNFWAMGGWYLELFVGVRRLDPIWVLEGCYEGCGRYQAHIGGRDELVIFLKTAGGYLPLWYRRQPVTESTTPLSPIAHIIN